MDDGMMLIINDDGEAEIYDDTYDLTIHCTSEEEKDEAIKRLNSMHWIPCSERLPSKSDHKDDMVLVCYGNGSVRFNTCKNGQWCQGNPLAWMPLPEPWKGERDEEGNNDIH